MEGFIPSVGGFAAVCAMYTGILPLKIICMRIETDTGLRRRTPSFNLTVLYALAFVLIFLPLLTGETSLGA